MKVSVTCVHCGVEAFKESGAVNRSQAKGAPLFCSKACCGLHRRIDRSDAEKRAIKAEYDRIRRAQLGERLLAEKREAYRGRLARDPSGLRAAQKRLRDQRKQAHAEYIRTPKYRRWKAEYDKKYCARKGFGDFGEAAILLNELETEISSRASWIEIRRANGTLNKHQTRRRDYERQTQRR